MSTALLPSQQVRRSYAWIGEGAMLRALFDGPGGTLSAAVLDIPEEQRGLCLSGGGPKPSLPFTLGSITGGTYLRLGAYVMTPVLPFGEVLEAADHLSQEEQEELIAILHRRLAQATRQRLAAEVQEARKEFAEGSCSPVIPEEIMREISK
jgi:hypothetical protein